MPSYQFTKFRVSIFMTCDADNQPLTENNVRKFVSDTILRTLDAGENPYYQALESDVHTFGSWGTYIPSVGSEEEMYDSYNRDILTEWIMQTDEMQEALSMFRGKRPKDKDDPEMRAWGYGHPQENFSSEVFSETLHNYACDNSDIKMYYEVKDSSYFKIGFTEQNIPMLGKCIVKFDNDEDMINQFRQFDRFEYHYFKAKEAEYINFNYIRPWPNNFYK